MNICSYTPRDHKPSSLIHFTLSNDRLSASAFWFVLNYFSYLQLFWRMEPGRGSNSSSAKMKRRRGRLTTDCYNNEIMQQMFCDQPHNKQQVGLRSSLLGGEKNGLLRKSQRSRWPHSFLFRPPLWDWCGSRQLGYDLSGTSWEGTAWLHFFYVNHIISDILSKDKDGKIGFGTKLATWRSVFLVTKPIQKSFFGTFFNVKASLLKHACFWPVGGNDSSHRHREKHANSP